MLRGAADGRQERLIRLSTYPLGYPSLQLSPQGEEGTNWFTLEPVLPEGRRHLARRALSLGGESWREGAMTRPPGGVREEAAPARGTRRSRSCHL
ncbi:hypothetical protein KL86PLE_30205 [uncultured Pleomorphomonas sp.]|uniref:Uncharacterized protein n=1 Tax=uncultured Pleomorphomonas sp. TaxID=442121 RepID=A0A212LE56_9HYPH|nr:hypothetical protein KL86PLE_30205 [uncultured Pleomorphomonas sp.]